MITPFRRKARKAERLKTIIAQSLGARKKSQIPFFLNLRLCASLRENRYSSQNRNTQRRGLAGCIFFRELYTPCRSATIVSRSNLCQSSRGGLQGRPGLAQGAGLFGSFGRMIKLRVRVEKGRAFRQQKQHRLRFFRHIGKDAHSLVVALHAYGGYGIGRKNARDHGPVAGHAFRPLSCRLQDIVMPALGELEELGAVAFAAGGRDVLEVDRALRIGRAEDPCMGILLLRCKGIPSMAFFAGDPVFLVYRSLPAVGLRSHETAARKPGMTSDAGISRFFHPRPRPRGEQQKDAHEKSAKKNADQPLPLLPLFLLYRRSSAKLALHAAAVATIA